MSAISMPTVDFCGTQVSRMILGDNPFHGHFTYSRFIRGMK